MDQRLIVLDLDRKELAAIHHDLVVSLGPGQ
jgi:hypothetical protein